MCQSNGRGEKSKQLNDSMTLEDSGLKWTLSLSPYSIGQRKLYDQTA